VSTDINSLVCPHLRALVGGLADRGGSCTRLWLTKAVTARMLEHGEQWAPEPQVGATIDQILVNMGCTHEHAIEPKRCFPDGRAVPDGSFKWSRG